MGLEESLVRFGRMFQLLEFSSQTNTILELEIGMIR